MSVGDSVAVGEIDDLVTANISSLELWRNWAAVVGMLGLWGILECPPFCVEREAEFSITLWQNLLGCVQMSCCHSNCMSLWQHHNYHACYYGNMLLRQQHISALLLSLQISALVVKN